MITETSLANQIVLIVDAYLGSTVKVKGTKFIAKHLPMGEHDL